MFYKKEIFQGLTKRLTEKEFTFPYLMVVAFMKNTQLLKKTTTPELQAKKPLQWHTTPMLQL